MEGKRKRGRPPKKTDYVDNAELKSLIRKWIECNPYDDGAWLERYRATVSARSRNNAARLEELEDFVKFRKGLYADKDRDFAGYDSVTSELLKMLDRIITGRLATYGLQEDDDMFQEARLALLKYLNRYDYRQDTSAFAYVTEVITNAINLELENRKKATLDGLIIPESELFDDRGTDEREGFSQDD